MTPQTKSPPPPSIDDFPFWFYPLIFLVSSGAYLLTLNPSLFRNDSPETITACITLGVSHPPGYPLFTLLGRLFSLNPIGNPALTLNLFSALLGAGGACLLAANLRLMFKSRPGKNASSSGLAFRTACLIGALSFAFSKNYWSASLAAKGGIYVFQMVLELAFLFFLQSLGGASKEGRTPKRFFFPVFLFAAGLLNHWPTQALLVPPLAVLAFAFFYQRKPSPFRIPDFKTAVQAFSFSLSVLSAYLYLPLRAHLHPFLNFEDPSVFGRFTGALLRADYARVETLASAPAAEFSGLAAKALYLSDNLLDGFSDFFLCLAVVGVLFLARRGQKKFLLFLLAFLLTTISANLLYLRVNPIEFWHLDDHLLGVNWALGLLGGYGAGETLFFLERGSLNRKAALKLTACLLITAALPLLTFLKHLSLNDQKREFLYHGYGMESLKSMDRGAFYFAESDYDYFSLLYLTRVEHRRDDLRLALTSFLTQNDWKQLAYPPAHAHPIYCAFPNGPFLTGYLRYAKSASFRPIGTVIEFRPSSSSLPHEPVRPLMDLWEKYLAPEQRSKNPINGLLIELCAHPYLNMADYLRLKGNLTLWDGLYDRALGLIAENPWLAETWEARGDGDLLLKEKNRALGAYEAAALNYWNCGLRTKAEKALQKASRLDPTNSGLKRLSAALE